MLRVCFIMEQHLGHQTYAQNIRRFLEHDPQIVAEWVPVTYTKPNGAIEKLPFLTTHMRGTLRGRQQVRAAMHNSPADAFFFNTQVPAALAGGLIARKPYVVATDITPLQYDAMSEAYHHSPDAPGLIKSYKHRINQNVFRGAARLLPWSSWTGHSMVHDYGADPARVEVLAPGVDLKLWQPSQPDPTGPLKILFVGGDFERKGGPLLINAFRSLSTGTAELHVVTRSALAREPGLTVYNDLKPNTPELIDLYKRCNVFVLPTRAEAFGIAAVEASAAGLPVIATRTGGLVDIVGDTETGYLIAADDEKALHQRLYRLAEDPPLRVQMGRAARKRAEQRFDARQNARRLVDCLSEIAVRENAPHLSVGKS